MKCNVCGRYLQEGQVFCPCGNTVTANGYDAGTLDLNVNRPSSDKIMLIAVGAGFAVFAIIAVIFVSALRNNATQITDRTKWQNISRSLYSITIPGNMKESDIVEHTAMEQMRHLDTFQCSSAIVDISAFTFSAEQKKYLKRQKAVELVKDYLKQSDMSPVERGEIFYVESQQPSNGAFWSSDQAWLIDAIYISQEAMYEIAIYTPLDKHEKYEDAVFAMLDSFRPKSTS